jgi:type II secretory pathway pseudopilin PulG
LFLEDVIMRKVRRSGITGQGGITFVETVVVFVLVGIVLAISVPSYRQYSSNQQALNTARTLASDLRAAQQEAVTRRGDITVTFSSAEGACGGAAAYAISQGGTLIKRSCVPAEVEWAAVPATLIWEPTGIPQGIPGGVTLTVRSVLTLKAHNVWVAEQTGAITDDTRRP